MASKIHGKQIKDTSIKLVKIDPSTGQTLTLSGSSKIQQSASPTADTDLTNKYYVDSVAAGFDPKASSRVATIVDLIGIGATYSPTGGSASTGAFYNTPTSLDGVGLTANDRILVKDQIDLTQNGIYVMVGPTATWYRSNDMDGNPTTEVSVGNFSFVTEGSTYGGNGFVVVASGTWSGILPINSAPIVWTQFSGGGSFIWGDGLSNLGNVINIDLAVNSGLTFSATKLTVDSNIAGTGLSWASGVLNVNLTTGLVFSGDNIAVNFPVVAELLQGNGLSASAGVINIIGSTGIGVNTDSIYVDFNVASNILTSGGTPSSLTASSNYLSVMIDNSTITRNNSGQLVANITSASGLAGDGLTSSGSVLNVGAANGITVSVDAVGINYTEAAISLEGSGLTASSGKLNVNTSNGIIIINDSVQLNQLVSGNGLTFSAGVIDINVVKGVTFSGDALFSDASTILTTTFLPNANVATNSTIQSALTAIDNFINGLQAATFVSSYSNPSGTFLASISTPVAINTGVTFSRASDGEAFVFMNGVNYPIGSATSSDFFFANGTVYSGALTASNSIYIGQYLWSNVNTLGFDIDTTDEVIVKYNAL